MNKILKGNIGLYFNSLLDSFSTLLFIRSKAVGLILLLATFLNPNIAILGVISWGVTYLFATYVGLKIDKGIGSIYTYNSLLVGFAIGFLFKIGFLSILLTSVASILTFLLTFLIFSIFDYYFKLPVLNIPFTLISMTIYLASSKYSSLFVESFYQQTRFNIDSLPIALQGLFQSVGILLFMPYDIIGIVILIAIFIFSRISFFLVVTSYYLGVLILYLFKGSYYDAFTNISSFNFILIGLAIGSIYLVPNRKSYSLAFTGVAVSVLVVDAVTVFWSIFQIPVFTLPFNLVVILFIYLLTQLKFTYINPLIKESPEQSLINYNNTQKRFNNTLPTPSTPFYGEWTLYQGFDDIWTHTGVWRYALDFVINSDEGKSYQGEGKRVEDYLCFGKPVLSPIEGKVVSCYDGYEDNRIGEVDKRNNWGNYIIIYSEFGYYVELSHLKKGSLKLKTGEMVKVGSVVGECGNSGYSPEPHIHMQVQYTHHLGGGTTPFKLIDIIDGKGNLISDCSRLKRGDRVSSISYSKKLYRNVQFILDDRFHYTLLINEKVEKDIEIKVKMDSFGSYYLTDDNGETKLYFGMDNQKFTIYSFEGRRESTLSKLFLALPSLTLSDEKLKWREYLPNYLFPTNFIEPFLNSIFPNIGSVYGEYSSTGRVIKGKIRKNGKINIETEIEIDDFKGFNYLKVCEKNRNKIEVLLKDD